MVSPVERRRNRVSAEKPVPTLLLRCADEIGVPSDPEFRSALVAYLEWGTRLAVINSQPGADVSGEAPMPKWGWGEVKGPYLPE
jgi:hemoglobin